MIIIYKFCFVLFFILLFILFVPSNKIAGIKFVYRVKRLCQAIFIVVFQLRLLNRTLKESATFSGETSFWSRTLRSRAKERLPS